MYNKRQFESRLEMIPECGCWIWMGGTNNKNYGLISFYHDKTISAHRFSWTLYNGDIPTGLCVLHQCDTKLCVNPKHLFLGTVRDNNLDCIKKKRFVGGRKISILDAYNIRADKRYNHQIAKQYGISVNQVDRIKNRHSWTWL